MDFSFLHTKVRSLCRTIVSFPRISVRESRNIMMMKTVDIDKNRNNIPEELLEELSQYIDDEEILLIAHKNVVRGFR